VEQQSRADLISDLYELREAGLKKLPSLAVPELDRVTALINTNPTINRKARIEAVLRLAVEELGGGEYGESGALTFGLTQGTKAQSSALRRENAAAAVGKSSGTFRKEYELPLMEDIADNLLALVSRQEMRDAWALMELRHPADSRLAVNWVERFESYNRLWTPIYALGADLTAARSTLLETDRPYDRALGTHGPDDPGYTQEEQADGYAKFALFRYAWYQWELQQFMVRHGGLWLFSSGEAEVAASDAVYQIGWHVTPLNERDDSWLRQAIETSPGHEMHPFLTNLTKTKFGRVTLQEWKEWVLSCSCSWQGSDDEATYFPIPGSDDGIAVDCEVHQVVLACNNYCDLIDREWRKIADWYHLDAPVSRFRTGGGGLYNVMRSNSVNSE
jgi:hypothetical protein